MCNTSPKSDIDGHTSLVKTLQQCGDNPSAPRQKKTPESAGAEYLETPSTAPGSNACGKLRVLKP